MGQKLSSLDFATFGLNAGTDILSGGLNYFTQNSMMRKQQKWAEKMWHMNNEYNLPINQRKRLDAAGINGALALSNAQTSSGFSQTPTSGNMSAPQFQLRGSDFNHSKQLALQEREQNFQREMQSESIEGQRLENQKARIFNAKYEDILLAQLGISKEQRRQLILSNDFQQESYQERLKQVYLQTEQFTLENAGRELDNKLKDTQYKFLPQKLKSEIAKNFAQAAASAASVQLINAQTITEGYKQKMIDAQIEKMAAEKFKTECEAKGVQISSFKAMALMKYEIDRAKNNSGADNIYQLYQNGNFEDFLNVGLGAFGTAALSAIGVGKFSKGFQGLKSLYRKLRPPKINGNTIEWKL